jgi:membrane-associated phospholipid phosphatase
MTNSFSSRREGLLLLVTRPLSVIARDVLTLRFRLENVVALLFFVVILVLEILAHAIRGKSLNASNLAIVTSAIALILAVEIADKLITGDCSRLGLEEKTGRPYWQFFRDWFPFVVILLMYYSLWGPATLLFSTGDRDAMLLHWDKWLFGSNPSIYLERIISPPLTAWMQFSYTFHLYVIPIVGGFIYFLRPRDRFRELMCGLVVVSFVGALGYIIVPAIGPMYTLHKLYRVALSPPLAVFDRPIQFIDFARVRRDCFPSLHVGISFLIWLYARRNSKTLFWVLCPFILSCWFSTVYLRFHYAVDSLAGLALAPLCFLLANALYERHKELGIQFLIPAAWIEQLRRIGETSPKPEEHTL